jgi:flagellar motor switch protein FliM
MILSLISMLYEHSHFRQVVLGEEEISIKKKEEIKKPFNLVDLDKQEKVKNKQQQKVTMIKEDFAVSSNGSFFNFLRNLFIYIRQSKTAYDIYF